MKSKFSKIVCVEDSTKSQQTPSREDNNRNESQRPHSEELLQTDNQCAVCDKIFDSQQLLIIHAIDDHPNDKAFKCADCSEVFSKIGILVSHRKTHYDLSKNLSKNHVCEFCSKNFKNNYELRRHLRSHTTKHIYACPLCEKTCKNEYLLQVHQKTHFKLKSTHSCKLCSKSFNSLNTLKNHLMEHNAERVPIKKPQRAENHAFSKSQDGLKSEGEKKNVCNFCSKSFLRKDVLKRHLMVHSGERPYPCPICNKAYKDKRNLSHHLQVHSKETSKNCFNNANNDKMLQDGLISEREKKNVCTFCSKSFLRKDVLKRHLMVHSGERPYPCSICNKAYKDKRDLRHHLKVHSQETSKNCDQNLKFKNFNISKSHEENLSIESNNCNTKDVSMQFEEYILPHVPISLIDKEEAINLAYDSDTEKPERPQNHAFSKSQEVLKSEGEKKNVCIFCSKSFVRKDVLKRHLMVHSGERPYPCSICNKSYKDKRDLSHHLNVHTKETSKTCETIFNISKSHEENLLSMESKNYKTTDMSKQFVDYILPHVPISLIDKKETINLALCSDTDSIDGLNRKNESQNKYTYEEETKPRVSDHLEVNSILKEHAAENGDITESQANSNDKQLSYKCAVCDKMFNYERDFIKHVKQFHNNSKTFKCRYCTASFSNARTLANHRRIHKCRNRLICRFCSKSFTCISSLKYHVKVHSVQRPYTCSLCEKTYKYNSHLKRHERITHLKLNSLCGKSFKHNINLTTHQNICLQSTSSLYENPIENHKMIDLEEDEFITVKCEANKESNNVESPLRFDLSNKFCQNDELSLKDNENHESSIIEDSKIIYSDNDSIDGKNLLEICKTECISTELVHPAVKRSKDTTTNTKFQQKPITDNDNRINKKTTKRHGVKRQIQTNNKCAVCNKMFIFQRDLIKHAQEHHHSRKSLKCRYCKERFSNIQKLLRHSRIHNEITKKHKCEFCLKHFSSKEDLKMHLNKHYEDVDEESFYKNTSSNENKNSKKSNATGGVAKKNCICELCSKRFPTMHRLNLHLISHTVDRPLVCTFCGKTFKHKSHLRDHEKTHMDIEKRFTCEICSKSFRIHSKLIHHLTSHTNARPYSCFQCKKTYKHKADVKKHQQICLQSIACSLCEKIFADTESLETHLRLHYVNKCAVCNKICNSQRDLAKHAREFHPKGKAFQCQTCSAVFCGKTSWILHKKNCLKLKSCAYCKKTMADDEFFKHHLVMHYVNKCAVCEKVCKSQNDLIAHAQKFHANAKAFKCPICDKRYASSTRFSCHKRTHTDKVKKDFYVYLYETKYKQNKDLGFLKFMEESGSNTNLKPINNDNQINQNQYVTKSYEVEDDSMIAEYLSDYEYMVDEVSQNDEDNAKETMSTINSLNIEILCNNTQDDDDFDVRNELNFSNTELKDVEAVVLPVDYLEDNSGKNYTKQEQVVEESPPPTVISPKPGRLYQPIGVKRKLLADNKCAVCHKLFKFQRDLIKHAQQFHRNARAFKCQCCKARFSNKQAVSIHNGIYHTSNLSKKRTCKICSTSFARQRDLRVHLKTHLTDPLAAKYPPAAIQITNSSDGDSKRTHFCDICSKGFSNKYRLNRHLKVHTIERPYSCSVCGNDYKHEYTLREHEKTHLDFSNSNHACELCYQTFSCASRLNRHLIVHSKQRPYSCSICGLAFKHMKNMKVHEARHLGLDLTERTHVCEICSKAFAAERYLKRHLGVHTGEQLYACSKCEKVFKNKNGLNKHLQTHSTDELNGQEQVVEENPPSTVIPAKPDGDSKRKHICDICSKGCSTKYRLKQHVKSHTAERPYSCSVCGKNYKYKNTLNQHEKTHLDFSISKHACELCFQSFSCASRLKRHLIVHTNEHSYTCRICGNNYKHEHTLRVHEKTHLNDFSRSEHACELCFQTFSCASRLKRHLIVHTKERPYSCSICGKAFKNMEYMKVHEARHFGLDQIERTYVCEICSMSFAAERHLKRHLGVHTGERPYACSMCEKVFKNKNGLNKHLQTHPTDELNEQNKTEVTKKLKESTVNSERITRRSTKLPANQNDLQESTPTNISDDIDVVGTDDNPFVSESYETNEDIIVVDEDNVDATTNAINSQRIIEDLFIRIVTP